MKGTKQMRKGRLDGSNLTWLKYVLAGSGIPIALVIMLLGRQPSRQETFDERVASAFGLPMGLMKDLERINATAEKNHSISPADWNTNLEAFHRGNDDAKSLALMTLVFLKNNNPHPKQSDSLAKFYISECKPADALPAMNLLYQLGDPTWHQFYLKGLQNTDPSVSAVYQDYALRTMKLQPEQIPGQ